MTDELTQDELAQDGPLLRGLRVVEMATWIFAPMSACVLGELGADVIKVEAHEGDPMRGLVPRVQGEIDWVWEAGEPKQAEYCAGCAQRGGQRGACAVCWRKRMCSSSICGAGRWSGWGSTTNRCGRRTRG